MSDAPQPVKSRPYQVKADNDLRSSFRSKHTAPILVMGTGGGKTHTFSTIAKGAAAKGNRVLIVAHRRELIKQASKKLETVGVQHGIIAPGHTQTYDSVQVGSIQTVIRRLDKIGEFQLIIIDEAHHAVSAGYEQLIASQPNARLLGVTASPQRLDGRGLGKHVGGCFDDMVMGPQSGELIEDGYLAPIRIFAPSSAPDLSGVKVRMGDYEKGALSTAMSAPVIMGCAVSHYGKLAPGKPAIVFCVSVEHAKSVAQTFRDAGWRAIAADGSMSVTERDDALGGLESGKYQVLCVCDLVSEGLDIVGIAVVIMLRATLSLVNFLQWTGRGLRPIYAAGYDMETSAGRKSAIAASSKPYCIVLDHAGCTLKHGLPDEHRDWSLEGRKKKESSPPVKQCPDCFAIHRPSSKCPECGHDYASDPKKPARRIEQVDGELSEIDREHIERMRAEPLNRLLAKAHTRADLHEIAKARGYNPGWVHHQVNIRRMRNSGADV